MLCASMYFDDLNLVDLSSARGVGQRLARKFFALVGHPFSQEKGQDMGGEGEFLGLEHLVGEAFVSGEVLLRPRSSLSQKVITH